MDLILASTSVYRKALLERLGLPFTCRPPGSDEAPLAGELPADCSLRLALAKAEAIAGQFPESLVIGSDQVATFGTDLIGKPGSFEAARKQLQFASGRRMTFYTGLALARQADGYRRAVTIPFHVSFRDLNADQIEDYLRREQPYDCAGSFKSEGLGIALFTAMEGDDPTALEGLPLIALTTMLFEAGLDVLQTKAN
ncbi:MAG: Maf family nucleotide pyrophosphatase [Pseudomonadota bacterium]